MESILQGGKWAILASVVVLGLASEAAAQSISISGVVDGWPHNVHSTNGFNGSWSSGSPVTDRRVIATPIDPATGRYSVACQWFVGGRWVNSFTVQTVGGEYRHRRFRYGGNPFLPSIIGEDPPVVIRVN